MRQTDLLNHRLNHYKKIVVLSNEHIGQWPCT